MNYFAIANELEDKLAEMLGEKNLLHVMDKSKYPITLTITQNQAPDAQMELFQTTDGSRSSQDSVLRLVFHLDRLEIQTNSRLVIDEKLMNKIKNQAKKIHAAHVHAYFANMVSLMRSAEAETEEEDDSTFDDFYATEDYPGDDLEENAPSDLDAAEANE